MSVTIGSRNMFVINAPDEEEKCTEAQLDILLKINTGEYRLVKKNKRSSVWNVYREIARSDGTKLKWRYFCLGCKRVMQSSGGTTSNLRIHKCHVKYLKLNGHTADGSGSPSGDVSYHSPPPAAAAKTQPRSQQRKPAAAAKRAPSFAAQFEQFYEIRTDTLSEYELEDDTEETRQAEEEEDEDAVGVEQITKSKRDPEPPASTTNSRPLLKLFSEESWSGEPELDPQEPEDTTLDEQMPIELDHNDIQQPPVADYKEEILQPKAVDNSNQFNASAVSEAESYAKSWAHAFLRLSDEQKFYAKRSIDELLVLGRLEKLSISTVTSLTTNL